jgi:hypothetical protein
MKKAVGFDQKILLHQLDFMAREIPRSETRQELYEKADEILTADIAGYKSRMNARTILFKIWYLVDDDYKHLQQEALRLMDEVSQKERITIHWGMTMLAYPFFKDLINEMGMLFKLQQEVSSDQISRKIKALYGDRRRVEVSISASLTSLRAWGVIVTEKRNMQEITKEKISIQSNALKQWIAEVLIHVLGVDALPIEYYRNNSLLFPFNLDLSTDDFEKQRFNIIRQGVDMRMVGLQK